MSLHREKQCCCFFFFFIFKARLIIFLAFNLMPQQLSHLLLGSAAWAAQDVPGADLPCEGSPHLVWDLAAAPGQCDGDGSAPSTICAVVRASKGIPCACKQGCLMVLGGRAFVGGLARGWGDGVLNGCTRRGLSVPPPAWGKGIRSLGLVSLVRGVQSRARGSQHPWGPEHILQEGRQEGGTGNPTTQRARRGRGERRKRLGLEGGGGSAHTHARLRRAEDEGGQGRGSHTTYCEWLKSATVPKC